MKLIIEDDEGRKTVIPLVRDEITIGRQEGNTIRLTERNVSRRHARLTKKNGHVLIEDVGSAHGVRVNGDRIEHAIPLFDGDHVQIGDYGLAVEGVPRPTATETLPRLTADRLQQATRGAEEATPVSMPPEVAKAIPPERMPHLMGLAGAEWAEEIPLSRTVMSFGRSPDANDIVIDHPSVSRVHGKFRLESGTWRVYDVGSEQGIRVNNRTVSVSSIQFGDTIEIGETQYRFCAPGETFKPPRGVVTNAGDTQVVRRPSSNRGVVLGLVTIVIIAGGAFGAWKLFGGRAAAPVDHADSTCAKADAAIASRRWTDAIAGLESIEKIGATCAFSVETALHGARMNLAAKGALDEGETLSQNGQFREALATFAKVPAESVYADGAKAKTSETRLAGVKQLSLDAQSAIDGGRLEAAALALQELEAVDAAAPTLPFLRKQLADKQKLEKKPEEKVAVAEAKPSPKPVESPTPSAKPKPEEKTVSQSDRDQAAQAAIQEGIKLMSQGSLNSGIARLQHAIDQKPRTELVALAHKNIGVGYAKAHQPESAISHLKIYLRLRPDAPDRAMIEKLVAQVEQK